MKTRKGIYKNINESEYIYYYKNFEIYFSSQFNKYRFETQFLEYIETENKKFVESLDLNIDITLIFMVKFYKKIEKRGFKINYVSGANKYPLKEQKIKAKIINLTN